MRHLQIWPRGNGLREDDGPLPRCDLARRVSTLVLMYQQEPQEPRLQRRIGLLQEP